MTFVCKYSLGADDLDVIVTNAYNRIGYNILRSLTRQGLKVGVGTDANLGMAVFSHKRILDFRHPSIYTNPIQFIERIQKILSKYHPKVYVPSDEDAFVVSRHAEDFAQLPVNIPVAPYPTIELLNNKGNVTLLAKSIGIPVPETIVPKDESDLVLFAREYGEPIVLKLPDASGAQGVFYLYQKDLKRSLSHIYCKLNRPLSSFIAQEYVSGTGYGVSMLFNQGKIRARFTHRRIKEKVYTGGPSSLRESTRVPLMEEYAENLLTHVGYHGVGMVEFKRNESTGRMWLLEVNPRFWGSVGLAVHSGVDFPYLLYRVATEGDVEPVLDYKLGVKVQWVLGSFMGNPGPDDVHSKNSTFEGIFR